MGDLPGASSRLLFTSRWLIKNLFGFFGLGFQLSGVRFTEAGHGRNPQDVDFI